MAAVCFSAVPVMMASVGSSVDHPPYSHVIQVTTAPMVAFSIIQRSVPHGDGDGAANSRPEKARQ